MEAQAEYLNTTTCQSSTKQGEIKTKIIHKFKYNYLSKFNGTP